jgi:hypothetical protein
MEKISRYVIKALGEELQSNEKGSSSSPGAKKTATSEGSSNDSFALGDMACEAVAKFLMENESYNIQEQLISLLKPQLKSYMIVDGYKGQSSLAQDQLVYFSSWFLPSDTVFFALKGLVLPQLSPPYGEPLQNIAINAICNSLPLAQPLLDNVVKHSVIHVLSEPWYRNWVKGNLLNNTRYYYQREKNDFSVMNAPTPTDNNKHDVSSTSTDEEEFLEDCPYYE